ncbi:response regulator [Vibrio cyclitrophicus]|nr:response regulator [Vibrio cyclitrophicus]UPR49971.1 response regulator [Vibrio cyclitrophicus]
MILVVEDEPALASVLCEYLEHSGLESHHIIDGSLVIDWVKQASPKLIILDLMLPNRDGLDIYRELRTFSDIPVVMATAKVEEIDRLVGLELGADDYICKPYSPREVVVRVKNILRRSSKPQATSATNEIDIDELSMTAVLCGIKLSLTPAEFRLLHLLYQNIGRIYSRDQLIDKIYDDRRVVSDRTIDSHIKNLRKKMVSINEKCDFIKSIYGIGYKLEIE